MTDSIIVRNIIVYVQLATNHIIYQQQVVQASGGIELDRVKSISGISYKKVQT